MAWIAHARAAMKALVISTAMTAAYFVAVTLMFRRRRMRHRAAAMLRLFAATVPLAALASFLSPADLWFLPPGLVEPFPWVDVLAVELFHGAAVLGGVLQLYNLAERGFSLRMLIDIHEAREGRMSLEDVMARYGGGRGIAWMYDKRIDDMRTHGLIAVDGDEVRLLEKGQRVARSFAALRSLLNMQRVLAGVRV